MAVCSLGAGRDRDVAENWNDPPAGGRTSARADEGRRALGEDYEDAMGAHRHASLGTGDGERQHGSRARVA